MQLVLDSNGISLKVRNKTFHVSKNKESRLISPYKVTSIAVLADVVFSSAAVKLATSHGIPIYFFARTGRVRARLWSPEFGNLATLRRKQVFFAETTAATQWAIGLFQLKTERQVANLKYLANRKTAQKEQVVKAIALMEKEAEKFTGYSDQLPSACSNNLMGHEGIIAKHYWGSIAPCLPEALRYLKRSRRPAEDHFNAALNYLYGMTYSVTERAVTAAGLDPYFGILHADAHRNPTFVYDMIEPFRPWVDRLLLEECLQGNILPAFFAETPGGFHLSKAGKAYLIPRYNEWLLSHRRSEATQRSTLNHFMAFAGEFTKMLNETDFN